MFDNMLDNLISMFNYFHQDLKTASEEESGLRRERSRYVRYLELGSKIRKKDPKGFLNCLT